MNKKLFILLIFPFLFFMVNVKAFDFTGYQTASRTAISLRNDTTTYGSTNCTSGTYCTLNFSSISTNPFMAKRLVVQLLDTFNTSFSLNTYYRATLFFTQNPDLSVFNPEDLSITGASYRNLTNWTSDDLNISTWSLRNVDDDLHLYQLEVLFTLSNSNVAGFSFSLYFGSDQWFYTTTGYSMRIYRSSKLENLTGGIDYTQDFNNVINNQNQNTQNVINNQNQNTQNIINNQNQNTQDVINSNKVCSFVGRSSIVKDNFYLDSNDREYSSNSYGITNYISINSSSSISIVTPYTLNNGSSYCFYNANKVKISCTRLYNITSITIPSNAFYFRSTINKAPEMPTFNICKSGNQAITDSLTDDDVTGANSSASNFFSSFQTDTYGLSSIITAPLTFIQGLTSQSCSPLVLPLPYVNSNLTLPCMTTIYSQNFGSFLTLYQTITFGIVSYWIIVRVFNLVKDFKNPDHDEIEVMDL